MGLDKIQVCVFDPRINQKYWFHFCYIDEEISFKFKDVIHPKKPEEYIKQWMKEDFSFELETHSDIYKAKDLIKDYYKEVYPEVYMANTGDRQGWCRVWLNYKINQFLNAREDI